MALYAFDGTGDRWKSCRRPTRITQTATAKNGIFPGRRYLTNIVLFYQEYSRANANIDPNLNRKKKAKIRHKYYFSGVGSSGLLVDTIFGGVFGVGIRIIARRAFKKLKGNFKSGDRTIDIVGYSRGAASARIFAHMINQKYERIKDENGVRLKQAPQIRFIGLFDTVVSVGNPFNSREVSFIYKFKATIPPNVNKAYHAMALDLNRFAFGLDRIQVNPAYEPNYEEVWFRGGHGDIGGNASLDPKFVRPDLPPSRYKKLGQPNRERTNIALKYMFMKAIRSKIQFKFELSNLEKRYPSDNRAAVILNNTILDKKPGSPPDSSREPNNGELFHHSFFDNGRVIPPEAFKQSGYESRDRNGTFAQRYVPLPNSVRVERDYTDNTPNP